MGNEWVVIVNPNAGKRKGLKDWKLIETMLIQNGFRFQAFHTKGKNHAKEITIEAVANGYRNFISVGGDGTTNEIINGFFEQKTVPTKEFVLGLIPVGTGNDWGRTYNNPLGYEAAIQVIKTGKTVTQDVGVVTYYEENQQHTHYFSNMAGMGFDAIVAGKTNRQKADGKSSPLSYYKNIFSTLFSYHYIPVEITLDDKSFKSDAFSMTAGICNYNGGGMKQSPFAIPDDGLIDLVIIGKMPKIKVLLSTGKLYDGSFTKMKEVSAFTSKIIKIESHKKVFLEADGESLGHSPFKFSVIPKSLNLCVL